MYVVSPLGLTVTVRQSDINISKACYTRGASEKPVLEAPKGEPLICFSIQFSSPVVLTPLCVCNDLLGILLYSANREGYESFKFAVILTL